MKKLSNILLALCIIAILLGLSGVGNEMVTGFSLAMGSIMFILTFITRMIDKAETTR